MSKRVLVVGGTGPTGVPVVNLFVRAGFEVAIYHTGQHESDFDGPVEHLHGDPREKDDIHDKLGGRGWDIAFCTSGRLRYLADELAGKTAKLVAVTGQPVYKGAMVRTGQIGLPSAVPESSERQYDANNYTGHVARGEDQLMQHHWQGSFNAVILRYPGVYGPRAPMPHEWYVVKRVLDRRPFIILPADGQNMFQRGYAENLAQLAFLACTRPEADGQAFNAADERVMTTKAVTKAILDELGSDMEMVGMPASIAPSTYSLAVKGTLILDMSKARTMLGYHDVVDPETATRLTARWLAENPPPDGGVEWTRVGGAAAFDYAFEDTLMARWRVAMKHFEGLEYPKQTLIG